MGTLGYYIIKFNGLNYIFYNHFDSYELYEIMAIDISNLSPTDFFRMKESIGRIKTIADYDRMRLEAGNPRQIDNFEGVMAVCCNPEKYCMFDITDLDLCDSWATEYHAILDLDQGELTTVGREKPTSVWSLMKLMT